VSGSRQSARTLLDGLGSHASRTEKNMIITLILVVLPPFIGLLGMFLVYARPLWSRYWAPNSGTLATERYARNHWWCPARRNRSVATGVSGFNLSIFPVNIQWRHRLISWLFPYYFWATLDRHGKCLGSSCAVWRWNETNDHGWCGLANRPIDNRVSDIHPAAPWFILAVLFLLISLVVLYSYAID
jgi:hypothetical protein